MRLLWGVLLLLVGCGSITYQQVVVDGRYVEGVSIEQQRRPLSPSGGCGQACLFPSNHLTDLIEELFRRRHFSLDLIQDVKYCIRQCINLVILPYSTAGIM